MFVVTQLSFAGIKLYSGNTVSRVMLTNTFSPIYGLFSLQRTSQQIRRYCSLTVMGLSLDGVCQQFWIPSSHLSAVYQNYCFDKLEASVYC